MVNRIWLPCNETIKQAITAGPGIVSIHTLELEQGTGRLQFLDVHDFPMQRRWYIVQRKGKQLSSAAQAFKTFVLEQAKDFICQPLIADYH